MTTEGNTLGNLFEMYAYYRRNAVTPDEAFLRVAHTCASLGDDGLITPLENETVTFPDSVALGGMKVELNPPHPNLGYYEFLSRWWFVSSSSVTSIAEPTRLLTKLHVSAAGNKPWKVKLFERACGIYSSERYTPVVSAWCKMVFRLLDKPFDPHVTDQYRQTYTHARSTQHWAAYADALGCTVAHLRSLERFIDAHVDITKPIPLKLSIPLPVKLRSFLSNFDISTTIE